MNRRVSGRHRNIEMMKGWLAAVLALSVVGCAPRGDDRDAASRPAPAAEAKVSGSAAAAPAPTPRPAFAARPRIVVLGDSLTAGLGLAKTRVVSGAAAGASRGRRAELRGRERRRVGRHVGRRPRAARLGARRRRPGPDRRARRQRRRCAACRPRNCSSNLAQIIERAQARGISVILAGMEAPPNYGRDYIVSFHKVYPALAAKYTSRSCRFCCRGWRAIETLNQRDGIHPTAAARASSPTTSGRC